MPDSHSEFETEPIFNQLLGVDIEVGQTVDVISQTHADDVVQDEE